MDDSIKLIVAIITLIAALISAPIIINIEPTTINENKSEVKQTNDVAKYRAPPAKKVIGLDGESVDPRIQNLQAPPASKIEGLDGLSID